MIQKTTSYSAGLKKLARRKRLPSEHYEVLLERLLAVRNGSDVGSHSIGIAAAARGAGASTVAANLAAVAAKSSRGNVLLVDASELSPIQAKSDSDQWFEQIEETPIENLFLLPTFTDQLSDSQQAAGRIDQLKEKFSLIVFDLPAAGKSEDGSTLAARLDSVLLVVEAHRAGSQSVGCAKQHLIDRRANVVGVVFNKTQ